MQLSPEIFRAQGNNQNQSLAGKLSLYMLRVPFFVSEKSTKIRRGSSLLVQWLRGHHLTLFSLPTHSPRAVSQGSPMVLNFAPPSLTSALLLFLMQLSPTCYPPYPSCGRTAAPQIKSLCNPPDSFVHGISKARILEWVAISYSRDRTHVSCVSYIGRWILYH